MLITKKQKIADLVHINYKLLPVINRFGITLGFGDKTIDEICRESEIDGDFFILLVNSFNDRNFQVEKSLSDFSVTLMLNYLKKAHKYYLSVKIPYIEQLISNLTNACTNEDKDRFNLVKMFFLEYKNELTEHIKREEEIVHPYIYSVEQAYKSQEISAQLKESMRKYSITKYASEHDNVEEKLLDLKNILIKYVPPTHDFNLIHNILSELFRIEEDLSDHQRIEEKVLIPKIVEMENRLIQLFNLEL